MAMLFQYDVQMNLQVFSLHFLMFATSNCLFFIVMIAVIVFLVVVSTAHRGFYILWGWKNDAFMVKHLPLNWIPNLDYANQRLENWLNEKKEKALNRSC